MDAIRRLIIGGLEVAVFVGAIMVLLIWRFLGSWRYLVAANRRALAAVRNAHIQATGRPATNYRILQTSRDRCYIQTMTVYPLGTGAAFEVWCYWYSSGQVEGAAVLSKYATCNWRAAIAEFEESGQLTRH